MSRILHGVVQARRLLMLSCMAPFAGFAVIPVATAQTSAANPDGGFERAMRMGAEAMHENKAADAEAYFHHANSLAQWYPSVLLDLGLAQLREGKLDAAEESIRTACQLDPKLSGANMFLGIVKFQMHRLDEAPKVL